MSVAVGISPAEVLELDGAMFDELEAAAARHWSPELELLASQLEVQSGHAVAYLSAHGVKAAQLPDVVRVPRPGDDPAAATPASSRSSSRTVSASTFARMFGPRVAGVEG